MCNAKLAKVFDARYQLLEQPAGLFFFQMVLGCDIVEELSVAAVFHDQEESLWCLYNLVHLDNVWVSYDLEDVDLSLNTLNIVYIVDLPLF